jgi:alpha-amylase
MHACGLDIYADVVLHQYDGGYNGTYTYRGADGKTLNGRFPKHPSCFVGSPPRVPVDPVANPQGNFGFGDMTAYINSTLKGYMLNGAIDAGDWLTRTLNVEGYRIDDTKGMAVEAVRQFLDSKAMLGRFAVGEYFDANPSALHWWVWNSGMGGPVRRLRLSPSMGRSRQCAITVPAGGWAGCRMQATSLSTG